MANSQTPAREKISLTSKEEVELAWLEAEASGEQLWDPALDRIRELGIAQGTHYHQLINSYAGSVSMLTLDLLKQPGVENVRIRQSIISLGSLVHHYLFNFETGEVALIDREISINTDTGKAAADAMCPPLVASTGVNYSRIFVGSGVIYNRLVVEEASHLDVFASPEASTQFAADTQRFAVKGSAIHTQPTVESKTYFLDEGSFEP